MNISPYLQFYKTIFPFIVVFSLLGLLGFGVFYGFFFFVTFGLCFGFTAFQAIYKNQWFIYKNLGISKCSLFISSFIINLTIGLPVFLFLFILISFILGDFSLT